METGDLIIILMTGLNIFQVVYWSRQVQKLVDKLMSRNYAEYNQSQIVPTPRLEVKLPPDDSEDLNALNSFHPR